MTIVTTAKALTGGGVTALNEKGTSRLPDEHFNISKAVSDYLSVWSRVGSM